MAYINLPVTVDSNALVQTAFDNIASKIPGWVPREGNLEVLLLEEFAVMAAEATLVTSNVQDAIFKYYGSLIGIPPKTGQQATINTTWNLVSSSVSETNYPAGTIVGFYYNGAAYQFQLIADLTIPSGSVTAQNILMQAVYVGDLYNLYNVAGLNYLTTPMFLLNPDSILANVYVAETYAENSSLTVGVNAETDADYLNRLSAELQLLAPRPITPRDYAAFSENVDGVYRTLSIDGYDPLANSLVAEDANSGLNDNANWSPIGCGGAAPSITSNLIITMASMPTELSLDGSSAANDFQIVINNPGSELTAPFLMLITGANNSEVVYVKEIGSLSGSQQTAYLFGPLQHSYADGDEVTILQGAQNNSTLYDSFFNTQRFYANFDWFQAAAITTHGTDDTGIPIVVANVSYIDNTYKTFSSVPDVATTTWELGINQSIKTIVANIDTMNNNAEISTVDMYVVWGNSLTGTNNQIAYASLCAVPFDFSQEGLQSPYLATSSYNWLPDADFSSSNYITPTTSWYVTSNVQILPNIGFAYFGGGTGQAASSFFNLSNATLVNNNPVNTEVKYFTAIAKIDASVINGLYTGEGNNKIIVQVDNGPSTIASMTMPATNGCVNYMFVPFSIAHNETYQDIRVQIYFDSDIPTFANGGAIVVSQMSVLACSDAVGLTTLPSVYQTGYSWKPGGNYAGAGVFNAPKHVAVTPIDATGQAVSPTIMSNVLSYLRQSREANFVVNGMKPNYVPINVHWAAMAMPGYDPASLTSQVNAAIANFVTPKTWGGGSLTPPTWDGTIKTVQSHDIATIINNILGIASVSSVTLSEGLETSADISSISGSSGIGHVQTTTAHKFYTGQVVNVSSGIAGLDVNNVAITVTSPNTFTYSAPDGDGSSGSSGQVVASPLGAISLIGPAPLPTLNSVNGIVAMNPTDALVGVF
jgi:hypothetical protein